jgi:hypothetical protein
MSARVAPPDLTTVNASDVAIATSSTRSTVKPAQDATRIATMRMTRPIPGSADIDE